MRSVSFYSVLIVAVSTTVQARGEWIGFEFDASAFTSPTTPPAPFGFSLTNFNPVTGLFVFNTNTPAESVAGCPNCSMYRQEYPDGFSATFNGLDVVADEYVIIISNDFRSGPTGPFFDIINIRWVSNLTNPLAPLTVEGTTQTSGLFSINLSGGTTIFTDTSLPTSLNLSSFTSRFSFLADTPTGVIDVPYNVTALRSVQVPQLINAPEPQEWVLIATGAICLCAHYWFGRRYEYHAARH